jgi:TolA protein
MNWNSDTGKALKISLILHGVIVAIVVIGSVVSMIFSKPVVPPHVFELQGIKGPQHVGAPGRLAGDRKLPRTDKPSTSSGPETGKFSIPKLDKSAPVDADDGDDAEPAPAKPAPKEKAKAAAKPQKNAASTKAVKAKGTKAVANAKASKTSAKPQSMSYSDFAKSHKISSGKSGSAKSGTGKKGSGKKGSRGGLPNGTGINASSIVRDMKNNLSWGDGGDGGGGMPGGTGMTSGEMDALADYFQRVRALIDANFTEPKGVMQQVSALVQFTILANGTVTGVSVVKSSGNDAFDAAAANSIRELGTLDPPPGNMAYTKKIEFVGKRGK